MKLVITCFHMCLRNKISLPRPTGRLDSDPISFYLPLPLILRSLVQILTSFCPNFGVCSWHPPTNHILCLNHFLIADHNVSAAWNALLCALFLGTYNSRSNIELCAFFLFILAFLDFPSQNHACTSVLLRHSVIHQAASYKNERV